MLLELKMFDVNFKGKCVTSLTSSLFSMAREMLNSYAATDHKI